MTAFKRQIIRSIHKEKLLEASDEENNSYELSVTYPYEDELIGQEIESKEFRRSESSRDNFSQTGDSYYRYTCDYSYDEICALMSIKYDSARKMVFRALKSLREHLDHSDLILLYLFKKV